MRVPYQLPDMVDLAAERTFMYIYIRLFNHTNWTWLGLPDYIGTTTWTLDFDTHSVPYATSGTILL